MLFARNLSALTRNLDTKEVANPLAFRQLQIVDNFQVSTYTSRYREERKRLLSLSRNLFNGRSNGF
jgi:hypothetical protein